MEEGEMNNLKSNVGKKEKRNLEWSCEGGGWITVLTISQDGTYLSRE